MDRVRQDATLVTHAHYIDGATARRARTRRGIGKVAPDPALRVVDDEPATAATAATKAPRKPARRGSGVAAKPALRVVGDEPATAATAATKPPRKPARRGSKAGAAGGRWHRRNRGETH